MRSLLEVRWSVRWWRRNVSSRNCDLASALRSRSFGKRRHRDQWNRRNWSTQQRRVEWNSSEFWVSFKIKFDVSCSHKSDFIFSSHKLSFFTLFSDSFDFSFIIISYLHFSQYSLRSRTPSINGSISSPYNGRKVSLWFFARFVAFLLNFFFFDEMKIARIFHENLVIVLVSTHYQSGTRFTWIQSQLWRRHFTYLHVQLFSGRYYGIEKADRSVWQEAGFASFPSAQLHQCRTATVSTSVT